MFLSVWVFCLLGLGFCLFEFVGFFVCVSLLLFFYFSSTYVFT